MMMRRTFLCVFLGLGLSACASGQFIATPVPRVGFQHLPKIRLDVVRVQMKSDYESPLKAPHVEQLFKTSPERAMFDWAGTRLVAVGGGNASAVATFVVEDAQVIETKLKKSKGFTGLFTYEPTARYDAHAVARLEISDGTHAASGHVRVSAQRSIEVSENATLAAREEAWMELVENLMADFNTQMDTQIQTYLGRWVKPQPLK